MKITHLTSEIHGRIGIEMSATAKEVATITKEKSQKCFKQTCLKENKLDWKVASWHIFDYDLHAFRCHYILLFYNNKNGQIVKILILRYYYIFFSVW